ncbi:MAG: type II secretion system F family protein [Microthrixaceae bacterium]
MIDPPMLALSALTMWVGTTLLLAELRWFRLAPLTERLRPYTPSGMHRGSPTGVWSAASIRDVLGPLATTLGSRLAHLVGVNEDLALRLERTGSGIDASAFRLRQGAWALVALGATAVLGLLTDLPFGVAVAMTVSAPLLVFLLFEQHVTAESQRWQQIVTLELPVVIEQLGMLLSSGYSLGAAIGRIGQRGRGLCARELRVVSRRIRQGVGEVQALREWAERSDITAVDRLVSVLALNWEAGDLGALISAEARAVRREVQRTQVEIIERRAQQVWIPVTVATLLPGVIFMAVPFIDAMGKLTGRGSGSVLNTSPPSPRSRHGRHLHRHRPERVGNHAQPDRNPLRRARRRRHLDRDRRADHRVPRGGDVGRIQDHLQRCRGHHQPTGEADRKVNDVRDARRGTHLATRLRPCRAPYHRATDRRGTEHGSGTLSTTFGVGVFLLLLMFASHVLLNLWIMSQVDTVAHDAAVDVAVSGASGASLSAVQAAAIHEARTALGSYGSTVLLDFSESRDDRVALRVRAPGIDLLPLGLSAATGIGRMDRTIVVEREVPDP